MFPTKYSLFCIMLGTASRSEFMESWSWQQLGHTSFENISYWCGILLGMLWITGKDVTSLVAASKDFLVYVKGKHVVPDPHPVAPPSCGRPSGPRVKTSDATVNSSALHSPSSPSLQAMECVLREPLKVYSCKDAAARVMRSPWKWWGMVSFWEPLTGNMRQYNNVSV